MTEQEFTRLLTDDPYQVLVFASRMSLPFPFAVHTWIVTIHKNIIHRWEVQGWKDKNTSNRWGHIHRDMYHPWQGMRVVMKEILPQEIRFKGFLLGKVQGEKNSIAEQIITFIEKNTQEYPFIEHYRYYPGPNSNTFIQWILAEFPESCLQLPKRAFGKNFLSKKQTP